MKIGIGTSAEKDPAIAAKQAITSAKEKLPPGAEADLAIVFSTIELASQELLEAIAGYLPDVPLAGLTGTALISSTSKRGVFKHGLVIILLDFPQGTYFNTAAVTHIKSKGAFAAGGELGEKLLYGCQNVRRDLSLVFYDGLIDDSSSLIYGLQEKLGRSFPLMGGSASDNLEFSKTCLYLNQEILSDAGMGILFGGGKLSFGMGIKHGWKPLGKERQVTLSRGNVVYKIDDKPAIKFYEEYLGQEISKKSNKEIRNLSILYPLGLYLEGEDEYLLRNLVSIEESGALRFRGDIPQDSMVRLMIGTKESCLQATTQATEEAKKTFFSPVFNTPRPGANYFVLVFDSVSRYILLGREAVKELQIIQQIFGKEVPVVGLYTYGEQGPLKALNYKGKVYSHNQTINILVIGG